MTVDPHPAVPDNDPAQPPDLAELRAETAAETDPDGDLPDGAVLVPLRDTEVAVLHPLDWPSSASEDASNGLWTSWAMKVLARDVDRDTWADIDPTNREALAFMNVDWPKAAGVPLDISATSRAMRRSSGRTAGR